MSGNPSGKCELLLKDGLELLGLLVAVLFKEGVRGLPSVDTQVVNDLIFQFWGLCYWDQNLVVPLIVYVILGKVLNFPKM